MKEYAKLYLWRNNVFKDANSLLTSLTDLTEEKLLNCELMYYKKLLSSNLAIMKYRKKSINYIYKDYFSSFRHSARWIEHNRKWLTKAEEYIKLEDKKRFIFSSYFGVKDYYSDIKYSLHQVSFQQKQVGFSQEYIKVEIEKVLDKLIDFEKNIKTHTEKIKKINMDIKFCKKAIKTIKRRLKEINFSEK
jgi:hypothetical protein